MSLDACDAAIDAARDRVIPSVPSPQRTAASKPKIYNAFIGPHGLHVLQEVRLVRRCGSWRYWKDPLTGYTWKTNGDRYCRGPIQLILAGLLMDQVFDAAAAPRSFGSISKFLRESKP